MRATMTILIVALLGPTGAGSATSAATSAHAVPPTKVGTCQFTTVRRVTQRLEDAKGHVVAGSGSVVILANGVYGVSYDAVPAVDASRPGDRAMTCLASIPQHCPPGDARGRFYTTTNLRTMASWTLPDSEHLCGGA